MSYVFAGECSTDRELTTGAIAIGISLIQVFQ